jgi:hypothetical protein
MTTISVDLAYKRYSAIGVVALAQVDGRADVEVIGLPSMGLSGRPSAPDLARCLSTLAHDRGARVMLIDGPQAWKSATSGLEHSRRCERALNTPGKTGLPGVTKPANYCEFIAFSIELFDGLAGYGWPRLVDVSLADPTHRTAVESFPTSAWRRLGLAPLPGKARATPESVTRKLAELQGLFPLHVQPDLTHDELQALVAGLAGLALERVDLQGYAVEGLPPVQEDGFWREGFIINPTRGAIARRALRA